MKPAVKRQAESEGRFTTYDILHTMYDLSGHEFLQQSPLEVESVFGLVEHNGVG